MKLPLFQVDAFASTVFRGNPAAICPLDSWLDEPTMQAIAAENNLSETAFFVRQGNTYPLRWFTPKSEIKLCGHATLASAFLIFHILEPSRRSVEFSTLSGTLSVVREGDLLCMDFPAAEPKECATLAALASGLSFQPGLVLQAKENYYVVCEHEDGVRNASPDFAALEKLHPYGVCVTGPGADSDFVSRYFAPSYGIPEDPVTGSTHCALIPYWANRLGKKSLFARQLSARGGELWCEHKGSRVAIKGKAALYMEGTIFI